MKLYHFLVLGLFIPLGSVAQTNTFPTSGSVGIGTTSPLAKLSVHSTGTIGLSGTYANSSIYMTDGTQQLGIDPNQIYAAQELTLTAATGYLGFITSGVERIRVLNNGNVGIGHSSPVEKLQIGNRWTFHDGGHKIIGYNYDYNAGDKRIFQDEVSLMRFTDYGDIRFEHAISDTANSAITDWAKSLTLKNDGRVGMGTDSPSASLHVSSSTDGDAVLKLESDTDNSSEVDNVRIEMLQDGGAHGAYIGYDSDWSGTESDNRFRIVTRRSGTNDEEAFVIKTTNSGLVTSSFVGIGTSNPDQALTVKGKIHSEEIIVDLNVPGPDYVFEEDYDLPTLSEIEAFIKANKHLPEVPSAKEMEANGISLGEMNMLLLKKIEEMTLHQIELLKRIEKLEEEK
ncbi:MAG: tail fiber protein [Balneolaceae bacterium]